MNDIKNIIDKKLDDIEKIDKRIKITEKELILIFIYDKLSQLEEVTSEEVNKFFDINFNLVLNDEQTEKVRTKIKDNISRIIEREYIPKLQRYCYSIERKR